MRDKELRWKMHLFGGSNFYRFGGSLEQMRHWWKENGFQRF